MTLRSTIMWLVLIVAAGTSLYMVKHQVQGLEDRLAQLDDQVNKDRNAIHVLHAEWAYLTRPERLAQLVKNHLDLVPPRPDQIVTSIERIPMAPVGDAPAGDGAPGALSDSVGGTAGPMKTARSTP